MTEAKSQGISGAMLDRLVIDDSRIAAMAKGIEDIVALADPVGTVLEERTRPNGLRIQRVRVPLGVIGIIYESRPNVTADAGALCLKSGNAVILRGGRESFRSSTAILECLREGLASADLPAGCIQQVPTRDRAAVGILLTMTDHVDLIVPRGGRGLIERVLAESRIPVLGHLEGICHVYVDAGANPTMARDVVFNAKMRRPENLRCGGNRPRRFANRRVRPARHPRSFVRGRMRGPGRRSGPSDFGSRGSRYRNRLGHRILGLDDLGSRRRRR